MVLLVVIDLLVAIVLLEIIVPLVIKPPSPARTPYYKYVRSKKKLYAVYLCGTIVTGDYFSRRSVSLASPHPER